LQRKIGTTIEAARKKRFSVSDLPNGKSLILRNFFGEASWRSGYAEDCKSLHPGSIPGEASKFSSSSYLSSRYPRVYAADPRTDLGSGLPVDILFAPLAPLWLSPAHEEASAHPANPRNVLREYEKAERDHPEAEDRQEAEASAGDKRAAESHATCAGSRQGDGLPQNSHFRACRTE
jgi:hypothetical protein